VAQVAPEATPAAPGGRSMQDPANEFRRIPLLGTSVNKVMMHLAILLAMGNSAKLQDVSC
jgi:hypothetical protein